MPMEPVPGAPREDWENYWRELLRIRNGVVLRARLLAICIGLSIGFCVGMLILYLR